MISETKVALLLEESRQEVHTLNRESQSLRKKERSIMSTTSATIMVVFLELTAVQSEETLLVKLEHSTRHRSITS